MCSNILMSGKWKTVFTFSNTPKPARTDTHTQSHKVNTNFPRQRAAHRGRVQVTELSPPHREPGVCRHGVSEEPGSSDPPALPHCCYRCQPGRRQPPRLSSSLRADGGCHWHSKSVLQSVKFPEKGGRWGSHLPKDRLWKYKVRFQLSPVRPTITFKLTGKWEHNWLFSSQQAGTALKPRNLLSW